MYVKTWWFNKSVSAPIHSKSCGSNLHFVDSSAACCAVYVGERFRPAEIDGKEYSPCSPGTSRIWLLYVITNLTVAEFGLAVDSDRFAR